LAKVRLFTDRRMLDHQPPAGHPERPERLSALLRHLERTGLDRACASGDVREATVEELARVHDRGYLEVIQKAGAERLEPVEPDTWAGPGSVLAAKLGAGAAIEAVRSVLAGPERIAFAAVRPPGHHARPIQPMGFCLFANAAVAAAEALEAQDLNRVLIVDFDVHHGNGTQEIFYEDPRVAFFSIHRHPFYPGTGARDETGSGAGRGWTRNLPTAYGTARREILDAFEAELDAFADRVRPELVILSAGFDAHAEDPVGDLGLEIEDFVEMTERVRAVAETQAEGRLVSLLEGGYNTSILAGCVEAHLKSLGAETS